MMKDLNKAVFTTYNVLQGALITRVFHDDDGDWQFFSSNEEIAEENARIISLGEAVDMDASLINVIKNLPKGYEAYREEDDIKWYMKYDDGLIKNLN